jgi:hypothetical protein
MTMDRDDPDRGWWSVPRAVTPTPWPRPGLKDHQAWAEWTTSNSGQGLRFGLLTALTEGTAYEYSIETEQQLLWLGIYFLTDMVKAGDEQLAWLIAEGLHKGLSWAEIGAALGISKQAAHKRFARQVRRSLAAAAYEDEDLARRTGWRSPS